MKVLMTSLAIAILALATSSRADDKTSSVSRQRFAALKALAGDWVEVGKDGAPTDKVVSSIRVTSGGHTIQETVFPNSEHEMVTMYHLDGDDLVLTHYCMLGNQPRMRAEPGADIHKILFKFSGSTNLKSNDEHHMHQATIEIVGTDHFRTAWVSCKDGAPCHTKTFDLVRKQK